MSGRPVLEATLTVRLMHKLSWPTAVLCLLFMVTGVASAQRPPRPAPDDQAADILNLTGWPLNVAQQYLEHIKIQAQAEA